MVQSIILKKSNFGPNLTFWPPWGLNKSFPKGNIYTVGSALLVSNFMQKNQKNVSYGSEDIFEKVNSGPKIWTFDPWRAWVRVFLRITYTSFEMPYYCLTSCKKSKKSGSQFGSSFWKSPILGQIWPFDPAHKGSRAFFENRKTSLFYIYAVITLRKISKTSGARILRYQRYGRTDGRSWIYRTLSAKDVGPKIDKYNVRQLYFGPLVLA